MKRSITFFALFILSIGVSRAQKVELSYGTLMGLNYSFVNVNSETSIYYPFDEKDRNFIFDNSYKAKAGYDIGILFKLNLVNNRFNMESGLILSKYNNSYTVSLSYDKYETVSSIETWTKQTAEENITNDFSVIKIPLFIGYNLISKEKFQVDILSGILASISMDENHTTTDMNMDETQLYKDYFTGYQMAVRTYFNNIICQLKYERSFSIQEGASKNYFPWEMDVDGIYLSTVSVSAGYIFH